MATSARNDFSFVEVSRDGSSVRFAVTGQVTINSASYMLDELEHSLTSGRVNIIIDMSRVTFFSSAGIRTVLSIFKKAKTLGGKLQISRPSENVRNVIGMTALDELLLK
jgi:anti-sigma B factor antagonist